MASVLEQLEQQSGAVAQSETATSADYTRWRAQQPTIGTEPGTYLVGGFDSFGKPGAQWVQAGFTYGDGEYFAYADDNATVEGTADRLVMDVSQYSHTQAIVQMLDNAKQMLFSAQPVAVPDGGTISFEFTMAATGHDTMPGDLRDGFASFNALDFGTGLALDFFTSDDRLAAIYARLPFPQMEGIPMDMEKRTPKLKATILRSLFIYFEHRRIDQKHTRLYRLVRNLGWRLKQDKFFAIFKETNRLSTQPGQQHSYKLFYDQGNNRIEWWVDGTLIYAVDEVKFKAKSFTLAYGLMTEKDLGAEGSVSCAGQGMHGEYSAITVTTTR